MTMTEAEYLSEIESCAGGNEQFQLPDGTMVGTGNLVSPEGPKVRYAAFPQDLLLDDNDIKRLLAARSIEDSRKRRKWRMLNQGGAGSCNAYMAIGMHYQSQEIAGRKPTLLQPEHLYMNINGGRDGGSMLDRGMQWLVKNGCAPHGLVPYQAYNRRQAPGIAEADREGQRFKIHEPYELPNDYATYVRAVASALAHGYAVGIAWHVGAGSMRLRNGFCVVGAGAGNHASYLHEAEWIGGTDLIHADLANSWGPVSDGKFGRTSGGWGEGGFGKMRLQDVFRTRRFHAHYVMTSVMDDPKGENPLG